MTENGAWLRAWCAFGTVSGLPMRVFLRLIRETGVKAVFAEPQYPESAANVIAEESGASFYFLDPAVTGENDPDAYLDAMEKNLETLKEALS